MTRDSSLDPEFTRAQVACVGLLASFAPAGLLVADNYRRRGDWTTAAAMVVGLPFPLLTIVASSQLAPLFGICAALIVPAFATSRKVPAPPAAGWGVPIAVGVAWWMLIGLAFAAYVALYMLIHHHVR